ncbi:unnamed protein product [Pleuronectes platessa]|uniref:Uncharacterized protein n=1 Tax=Pleuronectes platessa TaxID=8262 RepID=A0A9N7TKH1_PLEPL|nr:unnamed protein product [Pleuronectes platessa]
MLLLRQLKLPLLPLRGCAGELGLLSQAHWGCVITETHHTAYSSKDLIYKWYKEAETRADNNEKKFRPAESSKCKDGL